MDGAEVERVEALQVIGDSRREVGAGPQYADVRDARLRSHLRGRVRRAARVGSAGVDLALQAETLSQLRDQLSVALADIDGA
jgi:hypothetical protein